MNMFSRLIAALTLVALTGSAFAQSVSVGSVVGQKGNQVTLEPSFTAGGQEVDAVQFLVTFANPSLANFSDVTVSATCGGTLGTNNSCAVGPNKDAFQIIVSNGTNAMPTGTLASITFTIDGAAAAGDVALVVDQTSIVIGRDGVAADPAIPVSDGNITITDGPQPLFAATPASVALSGQISTTLEANVVIDNSGGEATSMLDYTCTAIDDADSKFTISGETTKVIGTAATGSITVACDSSAIGGPFAAIMQCTHNGTNPTVDIPLSCTVTAGPEPAYSGVAAGLDMVAVEQDDPSPTGSVTITNTGDATTTLTGTCTYTGDTEITASNGAFSVDQGAAAHVVGLSCDTAAEGVYGGSLSCDHNGTNLTPPEVYPVTCEVGPPGPSVYLSDPVAGSTIEMTPDGDVPVAATVADQVLTITNDAAEANDSAMDLSCAWAGSAEITVTAPTGPVAAQASTSATFSCSTAAVGAYTGTYTCDYHDAGENPSAQATYTVNCGVRAAAADILEAPVSGTALTILVPIGGTAQTAVNFSEILDEGVDATVDSCSFGTAIFSVVTTMPQTVTAGGTVKIDVSGSDNGSGALTFTDTLTCSYTDTDSTPGEASWPVTLTVLAQPIPTLSTWGLLLMILTLMGLGGIVIRRKVES